MRHPFLAMFCLLQFLVSALCMVGGEVEAYAILLTGGTVAMCLIVIANRLDDIIKKDKKP
jgi:hypothetical protein